MKLRILYLILSVLAAVLVIGCYPGGPEYTSDYDMIGATYDPEFRFDEATTFVSP